MKKVEGGFPYVAENVEGQLVAASLNNQLYSAIRRGADAEAINRRIRKFFEDEGNRDLRRLNKLA